MEKGQADDEIALCNALHIPRPRLNLKIVFPRYMGIPILKIRRSWDHLINMGIPILVRWHLYYIEMVPVSKIQHSQKTLITSQCVNSVPLYVRKLHFMYELVCTSSKYHWSIYGTSGKCCWSIYRTSRKHRGTLRVIDKIVTEFTHSEHANGPLCKESTGHQSIPSQIGLLNLFFRM